MLNHVALQCVDREQARLFYSTILNIPLERSFTIDPELTQKIFGLNRSLDVDVYTTQGLKFEVFFTDEPRQGRVEHICIEVPDKEELIRRCRANGIEPDIIDDAPRNRQLLFIKDFSENLFEVKEIPR